MGVILIIDNFDSFTWNLVHRLAEVDASLELGRDIVVRRNDRITVDEAEALGGGRGPSHVIVSPGPCTPREAGVSGTLIARFAGRIPILGVCLGHQCIADVHGLTVRRHALPMHGRTSSIEHDGQGVFAGIQSPLTATRYHSLVVDPGSVDVADGGVESATDCAAPALRAGSARDRWRVSAWTEDTLPDGRTERVVMGLRRVWRDPGLALLEGVQFHPESFMTALGTRLLANFLRSASRDNAGGRGAREVRAAQVR